MARRRQYLWAEWFGQPRTVLLRGVHYHCSQASMVQAIRNAASARGVSVRIADTGTEVVLEVNRGEGDQGQTVPHVRGDVPGAPVT